MMSNQSQKRIPKAVPAVALLLPIWIAATSPTHGQESVEHLIQETTVMVVEIDTAKLDVPRDSNTIERLPEPLRLDLLPALKSKIQSFQTEADQMPVRLLVSMPISGLMPDIHVVRRQSASEIRQRRDLAYYQQTLKGWQFDADAEVRLDGNQIVVGPSMIKPLADANSGDLENQFAKVLTSIGDLPVKIAIVPPRYAREALANTLPEMPQALGGIPTSVVLDGIQTIGIGLDPQSLTLKLRFQSADKSAAQSLAKSMPAMLRSMFRAIPWFAERLPNDVVLASIDQLGIEAQGDAIVLSIEGGDADEVHLRCLAAIVSAFAGEQRTMSATNQLKRIGLAVHNHHSAFRFLPPWQTGPQKFNRETIKENTNTQLSWRVYLLPFLGESELFQQFHLDEPWDSPHNKTLLGKMPDIYLGGSRDIPSGHTTVLAPRSDQAILNTDEPTSFRNVLDGLSNTVMVVEVTADLAVPWTAPQDYEFDPASPVAKLAVDGSGQCTVLFGDGSVRKITKDLSAEQGKALFGRNDGIPIDLD